MTTENYIVVGDIHGRYDLLSDLLGQIERSKFSSYRKVFLGDMVDRGNDSFKVVETVKKLVETENAIALYGNHEDMMMEYASQGVVNDRHIWIYNGGKKTIDSYCKGMRMYGGHKFFMAVRKSLHYQWIQSLPLFYETDKVWFSHAPVPDRKYRDIYNDPVTGVSDVLAYRNDKQALTWSWHGNFNVRENHFAMDHGKTAVCGHVHAIREGIFNPRTYPNIIYADTGSGCHRVAPLTGVILSDGKYSGYLQATPKDEIAKETLDTMTAWSKSTWE